MDTLGPIGQDNFKSVSSIAKKQSRAYKREYIMGSGTLRLRSDPCGFGQQSVSGYGALHLRPNPALRLGFRYARNVIRKWQKLK
jgi:hypothetical protein